MSTDHATRHQAVYERVCTQHDGIAEFRGKLLSLLPIASGAGIFLLFEKGGIPDSLHSHLFFIGLFGLAVTTGLFFYELRGIQNCNALIQAARDLEHELSPELDGPFRAKPHPTWIVGAETAALIVYPAVAGAWAYLGSLTLATKAGSIIAIVAAIAVAAVYAGFGHNVLQRGHRTGQLERQIRALNRQSFLAEDRRDRSLLEPILAHEFRIVRARGVLQNKTEMLDGLATQAEGRREIKKELIESRGPNTVIAMTLITYYQAGQLVGDFWNTKVFVRDVDTWRCRTWQVAAISE
jgi:hypothetical protein